VQRRKHGFDAPVGEWLRGPLAGLVDDLLLDKRFVERGILNAPAMRRLWHNHMSRRRDKRHRLCSLLMLELWFRAFVDSDSAVRPVELATLRLA
jgi:asparagine synthase (glutamine-hydrolysing)